MIGIYCIATGSYKLFINDFLYSLRTLRPTEKKTVVLFTDSDDHYESKFFDIINHRISDAPWPIIALLKMWYINKYKKDYSEVYYFDIDTQIKKDLPPCNESMLCTRHFNHTHELDGHEFLRIEDDIPESQSYIGNHKYDYIQSGFFGGKPEIVYKMCEDVAKWVEDDLKLGIIPRWHDESYLNKWRFMNQFSCKIIKAWDYIDLVTKDDFIPKK